MGKKSERKKKPAEKAQKASEHQKPDFPLIASSKSIDPTLHTLFSSSLGPVKAPERVSSKFEQQRQSIVGEETGNEGDDKKVDTKISDAAGENFQSSGKETLGRTLKKHSITNEITEFSPKPINKKKRRRSEDDEELEDKYLRKVQKEEQREFENVEKNSKKAKLDAKETKKSTTTSTDTEDEDDGSDSDAESVPDSGSGDEGGKSRRIAHEAQLPSKPDELEKAARTIFLGNVPTTAITSKSDYKLLKSAFSAVGKISSIRFRSIAFSEQMPRKMAFKSKKFHEQQQTVNAYIVYKTAQAAREALKLNGTVILDRHIRVDSIAHPAATDAKRCVFIGNLDFEAQEESLWRHFGSCGKIESVRVIRDPKTNVGKGFAYVQFEDPNAVEKALLLDGQKMAKDRKLRISRAKNIRKPKTSILRDTKLPQGNKFKVFVPKDDSRRREMLGRANKLLGKAGASKMKQAPEVFEGLRATRNTESGVKLGGTGKRKGKPRTRATVRSAAWRTKAKK